MTSGGHHIPLAQAYDGIIRAVEYLDDTDLQRPTRCRGWLVADLLLHIVGDAQRALVALASPVDGPPDTDDVSWRRSALDDDSDARHAWWIRRSAAAYHRPTGIVRVWTVTAPAAVHPHHRGRHPPPGPGGRPARPAPARRRRRAGRGVHDGRPAQ